MLIRRKASMLALTSALLLLTAVMAQLARLADANPYIRDQQFSEVPPPAGIDSPNISVLTPKNNTVYNTSGVALVFDVYFRGYYPSEVYYNSSWQHNSSRQLDTGEALHVPSTLINDLTLEFSIRIEGIPEGPQWLEVYAIGEGFNETGYEIKGLNLISYIDFYRVLGSSAINFTVDTIPPFVYVLSVENRTYYTSEIPLDFRVNEAPAQITYVLDGLENVTTGNITLSGLTDGAHNITIYALDAAGNIGSSETIYFTIAESEPFPTTPIVPSTVLAAVIGTGIMVYNKKRSQTGKHTH